MILLDSHVIIWLALKPDRISRAATAAIRRADEAGELSATSAVCLFEIANAIRRGRVQIVIPADAFLGRIKSRFKIVPVSDEIAIHAGLLGDPFHGDPIDRLIAATAILENCTLTTSDRKLLASGVCETLW